MNSKQSGLPMSDVTRKIAEDRATESQEKDLNVDSLLKQVLKHPPDAAISVEEGQFAHTNDEAYQGEQSVMGTNPDPEADDDTLQNAQMMGQQLAEDPEHPEEIDIARDTDAAEEYLRTH